MQELIDLLLHADEFLIDLVERYGTLTYLIVFAIIFIETGLVIVTFFPGDGLLFSLGIIATQDELSLGALLIMLSIATILGNTSNYLLGRYAHNKIFRTTKAKQNVYLDRGRRYYVKYGEISILLSRYFPFLRSFVPFSAGVAKMDIKVFTVFNIVGGILWIHTYILLGYFFGEIPWVRNNFGLVFAALILVLLAYLLWQVFRLALKQIS